jgi:Xaa-Pro dipeptidase
MTRHFARGEYKARQARLAKALGAARLDGILLFRPASLYWLTGYDTQGSVFQALYFGADARLALVTKPNDARLARTTSVIIDIREWVDREGGNPALVVRGMLADLGVRGCRVGIEYDAPGLSGRRARLLDGALEGFCRTEDASDVVRVLRLVKSPAEIAYLRTAGRLADAAQEVCHALAVPGASIGGIHGAMVHTIMAGGGDPSASRWPAGAGAAALNMRYHTGPAAIRRRGRDQATFEFAAAYRHYHVAGMTVVATGGAVARQREMFRVCKEALAAAKAQLRHGRTCGDVFEGYRRIAAKHGYAKNIMGVCGYPMGAVFPPTWMEDPFLFAGSAPVLAANMTFFIHIVLLDSRRNLVMAVGETELVTKRAPVPFNHAPRELVVNA